MRAEIHKLKEALAWESKELARVSEKVVGLGDQLVLSQQAVKIAQDSAQDSRKLADEREREIRHLTLKRREETSAITEAAEAASRATILNLKLYERIECLQADLARVPKVR